MQQQADDPPFLVVGTDVSAKYKGAFCEAKVRKVVRNIKCKVQYKQGLGTATVQDDQIKGTLRVGANVEVRHPERREYVEATITKIQDCSQYTVVFDDGDITTLRRSALCLKSGRHFNEMTLDELPLTHPEHFGNPVVGGRRGRRSRHLQDGSSDEEDEVVAGDKKKVQVPQDKEENIGKVVFVENTDTKKKTKESWFPALVVAPTAQDTVKIRVKDDYLVRSFKDGRYYTVPKKEALDFTRELAQKNDGPGVAAAIEFLDNDVLPAHWDRDVLFGVSGNSSEDDQDYDSDSSDDEPTEEKDHFVAQLYKFMDDRGTPLNKGPSICNKDVDLYRLFRTVQKLGGYNRVTSNNQWKAIANRLGFSPASVSITNLVKQAYKKFLHSFEEFNRKLGCTMISTPRNRPTKGRSLVRASSVASPKPIKEEPQQQQPQQAQAQPKEVVVPKEEPADNVSESGTESVKAKRKERGGKVKVLVEKFEDKTKEVKEEKETTPVPVTQASTPASAAPPTPTTSAEKPSSVVAKKEKPVAAAKKPEEKRGRKRKDTEPSEKKEEPIPSTPAKPSPSIVPAPPVGAFKVEVGDKLRVYYHEQKVTYEAKVVEIAMQDDQPLYLVHYTGWNTRYDEWVRRDRIAENLSNSKTKKMKGGVEKKTNQGTAPAAAPKSTPNATTTAAAKRGRGNSKSDSGRSTTPSAKSPGAAASSRRVTRGQPGSTRRTSNNTDISSLQTDTDTDSDEPIKKSTTQRSTSSSAASTTKAIASDKSNVTESSDEFSNGTKGRDYDLNQIRSELKGLKSSSPALENLPAAAGGDVAKIKNEDISNVSTKSNLSTASTSDTVKSKIATKFSGASSESEFGEDDSQSSNKTFCSENLDIAQMKLIEKSLPKTVEKVSKLGVTEKVTKNKTVIEKKAAVAAAAAATAEKETPPEEKVTITPSKSEPKTATKKETTPKAEKKVEKGRKSRPESPSNLEKSIPKSVIEKSTAKTVGEKAATSTVTNVDSKVKTSSDIYEFKEPEPFEFEAVGRKNLGEEAEKKRKATETPPLAAKKGKKSPIKEEKDDKLGLLTVSVVPPPVETAFDVLRKSPSYNKAAGGKDEIKLDLAEASKSVIKSVFLNTTPESPVKESLSVSGAKAEGGSEFETVKKILIDSTFELEPPKIEKPSSIADKVLKALTQKSTEEPVKEEPPPPVVAPPKPTSPLAFLAKRNESLLSVLGEPPKIEVPTLLRKELDGGDSKKPALSVSADSSKVDILESISPKNHELSETIQKLESVIQKGATVIDPRVAPAATAFDDDDDDSDSTDSEQRLVIEDESLSSETIQVEEKSGTSYLHETLRPSLLMETIQGHKPYATGAVSVSYEPAGLLKKQDEGEPPTPAQTSGSDPIPLLLCEETIPGSPAPTNIGNIKDSTEGQRKVYADSAFLVPPSVAGVERPDQDPLEPDFKRHKTHEASDNSPPGGGSMSQDDSKSDSEKNAMDDITPKKRKRQRKSSETDSMQRRRRGRGGGVAGTSSGRNNGTDSEDNSDAMTSQRALTISSGGRSPKPCQYNFLVQLDPAMNSNQRITLLRKKIQELRKTYNTIKSELASIERRRKKMRRREREKQKKLSGNA